MRAASAKPCFVVYQLRGELHGAGDVGEFPGLALLFPVGWGAVGGRGGGDEGSGLGDEGGEELEGGGGGWDGVSEIGVCLWGWGGWVWGEEEVGVGGELEENAKGVVCGGVPWRVEVDVWF